MILKPRPAGPVLNLEPLSGYSMRLDIYACVNGEGLEPRLYTYSLVPRPFLRGRGKTAWAPLLAHARRSHKNMGIRARLYIVRLHISNLP